jgi:hypothetical protein
VTTKKDLQNLTHEILQDLDPKLDQPSIPKRKIFELLVDFSGLDSKIASTIPSVDGGLKEIEFLRFLHWVEAFESIGLHLLNTGFQFHWREQGEQDHILEFSFDLSSDNLEIYNGRTLILLSDNRAKIESGIPELDSFSGAWLDVYVRLKSESLALS